MVGVAVLAVTFPQAYSTADWAAIGVIWIYVALGNTIL